MTSRTMKLIAFMQAQNCSNYVGSWRSPASVPDFLTPAYYQRIARTLEDACFDMAFFDDRLAMPDIYGGSADLAVEHGIRTVKMDPTIVLTAMAAVTTHLGLGATASTTYFEPFDVARRFMTLDQMTGGRIAWNIVTSLNSAEANNFGKAAHLDHDRRYDRADEFVQIVRDFWTAWDPDALVIDKQAGRFADPAKVHRTTYHGDFFDVDGTFTVPQSPQGHPVLLQAGQSGRGLAFAGRWAEVVFTAFSNIEKGAQTSAAIREAVAAAGRDPEKVAVTPAVGVIVAETEELAKAKEKIIRGHARQEDGLVLLCETLNVDFSGRPVDKPFADEELAAMSWHGLRDRVIATSGTPNPSVADFVTFSGRGTIDEGRVFRGTPSQVADQMQEWFDTCCDGFVLSASTLPGSYEDFARLVVPELQRRDLVKTEYAGTTLRENLGLDKPSRPAATATGVTGP
ncbi:LLM class flavin-dependent oxidoreductase [Amycolatopsis sp. H20-H5]|uniref:LLM class flavin-dependent oxidoreductase n=1 Tax=Amycolatopsis sp. H20-H5 TaxID=3046309 RepID=UPI002DB8B3C2|nr:LLM class flavin-dependent oxidoreductase [Amycolatopsis sp. H20-H5]MEC3974477.1 LLM class flavin-dependent oxidoreductase [Amycolatopsis sp. H20-H5]